MLDWLVAGQPDLGVQLLHLDVDWVLVLHLMLTRQEGDQGRQDYNSIGGILSQMDWASLSSMGCSWTGCPG